MEILPLVQQALKDIKVLFAVLEAEGDVAEAILVSAMKVNLRLIEAIYEEKEGK